MSGLMDGPTSFVACSVGERKGVGSIELCLVARMGIYQAHTCVLHMHAHTRPEARMHAHTCPMGCKAIVKLHLRLKSFYMQNNLSCR